MSDFSFSAVFVCLFAKSCLPLGDRMDCSLPGFSAQLCFGGNVTKTTLQGKHAMYFLIKRVILDIMAKSSKFLLVFSKGREVVTTAPTMRHLVSQLLYWGTCSDPRDKVKLQIISWPVICWTGKKIIIIKVYIIEQWSP